MSGLNYGMDKDLKAKQLAKYDVELEKEVTAWIEAVTGEQKQGEFGEWLKDGKVLCNLVNCIKPGTIKKINAQSFPFKQMENITYFMNVCRDWGVPEMSLFGTPDLYEGKNLGSVVNCINMFGGAVQAHVPEFTGPKLGIEITVDSKDKKRQSALLMDQSGGFSSKLEMERPSDGAIIRGQATTSPRPSTSPRPADPAPTTSSAGPNTSSPPTASAPRNSGYTPSPEKSAPAAPAGNTSGGEGYNFGLDAELKAKQDAKYDVDLEQQVTKWIEEVTGESRGENSMQEWLKDGKVLCNLANKVQPGAVKSINTSKLAFKQMENITFFMDHARGMGVPEYAMFGTPDLYEDKNMGTVIGAIYTYGGAIQVKLPNFSPKIGIALNVDSKDGKREGGLLTDQSSGYAKTMEVQRPTERADYCVKPIDRR